MAQVGWVHAPGATPPDPEELAGLIPRHVSTQEELNQLEEANIALAVGWIYRTRPAKVLSEDFARKLHKRMFNKTWRWAGTFRTTEKSIGVDPITIAVRLRDLFDDARAWVEYGSYPLDEQAVRLHHRLVLIHPFPNGNGRHARLLTDAFMLSHGAEPFTWGGVSLTQASATRSEYIAALRAADARDYAPLLGFVRT